MYISGAFNKWSNRYAILSSATLVYFKNEEAAARESAMGIVYLRGCDANVRKSKKHGFCFMITNRLGKSIYSSRGLKGEMMPRGKIPMGGLHHCILRVEDIAEGESWLAALREAISMANKMTPEEGKLLVQEGQDIIRMQSASSGEQEDRNQEEIAKRIKEQEEHFVEGEDDSFDEGCDEEVSETPPTDSLSQNESELGGQCGGAQDTHSDLSGIPKEKIHHTLSTSPLLFPVEPKSEPPAKRKSISISEEARLQQQKKPLPKPGHSSEEKRQQRKKEGGEEEEGLHQQSLVPKRGATPGIDEKGKTNAQSNDSDKTSQTSRSKNAAAAEQTDAVQETEQNISDLVLSSQTHGILHELIINAVDTHGTTECPAQSPTPKPTSSKTALRKRALLSDIDDQEISASSEKNTNTDTSKQQQQQQEENNPHVYIQLSSHKQNPQKKPLPQTPPQKKELPALPQKEKQDDQTTTTNESESNVAQKERSFTVYEPHKVPPEIPVDETEKNKSIVSVLTKQLSSGDTSMTLPVQYLEPSSFLESIIHYFTYPQLLSEAAAQKEQVDRFIGVLKWYLSNFHCMAKTLKKPYNPVLGERLRTVFVLDKSQHSKAYFIAEQVSHHPPISAFHCSARKAGWAVGGSLLAKSSFNGKSITSSFDSNGVVIFPELDEYYEFSFPSLVATGLIFPPVKTETLGTINFRCNKGGLDATIEFKAKPTFGGEPNQIAARLRCGKDVLYTISGRFDREMTLRNMRTKAERLLLDFSEGAAELPQPQRYDVPRSAQHELESEFVWRDMTDALFAGRPADAFAAKRAIEERQRELERKRRDAKVEHVPALFVSFDRTGDGAVQEAYRRTKAELLRQRMHEDERTADIERRGNCWWRYADYDAEHFGEAGYEEVEQDFALSVVPRASSEPLAQPTPSEERKQGQERQKCQSSGARQEPIATLSSASSPQHATTVRRPSSVGVSQKVVRDISASSEQLERLLAVANHVNNNLTMSLAEQRRVVKRLNVLIAMFVFAFVAWLFTRK